MDESQNKRQFPRISRTIEVEVSELTYPFTDAVFNKGDSIDIGSNGIRFHTADQYEPGAMLNLKINITGWESYKKPFSKLIDISSGISRLTVVAEVVWCHQDRDDKRHELGVKFLNIYEDDYQALMRFLNG